MPEGDHFLGVPAVKGGQSLPPFPAGIGLTDLPNIGGGAGHHWIRNYLLTLILLI